MGQGVFCRHYLGRRPHLIWLLVAVSLLASLNSFAAAITWGKATTISNDTDVVTSGSLAYAYDEAYYATAVNGVPFGGGNSYTALGTNIALTGNFSWSTTAFGTGTGNPWDGLSSFYQTLLRGGAYAANNSPMSITLTYLQLVNYVGWLVIILLLLFLFFGFMFVLEYYFFKEALFTVDERNLSKQGMIPRRKGVSQ